MAHDRESNIHMAKLAEQAERYEEMVEFMKAVACANGDLSVEERNLLSVAFKNLVGSKRSSWRIMSSIEMRGAGSDSEAQDRNTELAKDYRLTIEKELKDICGEILTVLDKTLVPKASGSEAKVFYHKMKADYCRYLAEFAMGEDRKQAAENSLSAYKQANDIAGNDLPPTHPIRLGLALNFSVFYYEILNNPERACRMAKAAFDDAIAELDSLSEDTYKDSTLIMQLLRDNLTLWTTDIEGNDETGDAGPATERDIEKGKS